MRTNTPEASHSKGPPVGKGIPIMQISPLTAAEAQDLYLASGAGAVMYQEKDSDCYHYNLKGNVVVLADGSGKLAAYYEYDAWGNAMTEAEKTGVENPYRYSTKEWDEKSGLGFRGMLIVVGLAGNRTY